MRRPRITVVITVYDRPEDVLRRVFDSLAPQPFDEAVIVLDRTPAKCAEYCRGYWRSDGRVRFVEIAGKPGWLCPARAWNVGFGQVDTELVYCLSSEVIQDRENIRRTVDLLADQPAVLFGKAECSCGPQGTEVNWGGTAPGNLLVDSAHPRHLGFIWACPTWILRATGGFDEGFGGGFWYDDDDFNYRIWQQGAPFVFDDTISGFHQHHERPELSQEGIARNLAYITKKHPNGYRVIPNSVDHPHKTRTWWSQ